MFFATENFRIAIQLFWQRLPEALAITLTVTVGAVTIGAILGLALAFMRLASSKGISRTAQVIISVLRTVPVPSFMLLVYFFLVANVAIIQPAHAGMLALGILLSPYLAEIFRSGIQTVRQGQIEAALALGMSLQQVQQRVILPQALRIMLPAIGATLIVTLLNSAFVAAMGARDLTGMSRNIINAYFTSELYLVLALVYFIMAYPLSRLLSFFERRMKLYL